MVQAFAIGSLAQLAEQGTLNPKVVGSTPTRPTNHFHEDLIFLLRQTRDHSGLVFLRFLFSSPLPFSSFNLFHVHCVRCLLPLRGSGILLARRSSGGTNLMADFHIKSNTENAVRDSHGTYSTAARTERAVLAHLSLYTRPANERERAASSASSEPAPDWEAAEDFEESASLDELAGLAEAAGAQVAGRVTQKRQKPDPATLFGKGKVEEIKALCADTDADVVIVDCDLSPAQGKNLEETLKIRVIDRTELILDIFARRAQTAQAKLQIELAQLRYQLPRLKRMWVHLGRTGGGIGTRGPGETQLETDRSMARDRVTLLERQLDVIRKQKKVESASRYEFELGALVGYTNVGKSALLNALSNPTGKRVYEADQLFATLGSSTRKVELGAGRSILLSDTVGFVRRLPHFLVESFHSTLNEVENADFLLLVVDGADPEMDDKLRAVQKVLNELQVLDTPHLLVLNQCDRLKAGEREALAARHPEGIFTSALTSTLR